MDSDLQSSLESTSEDGKELVQALKLRINESNCIVGTYIGPQTSNGRMETEISRALGNNEERKIMVGDLNARHRKWDKVTNGRGKTIAKLAQARNLIITPMPSRSYIAKGRVGESYPDLMLDKEVDEVTQPMSDKLDNTSDHTQILYVARSVLTRRSEGKVSKTTLNNPRNIEEAGDFYRTNLRDMIEEFKQANGANAESCYKEATEMILQPWKDIINRCPKVRKPHWTFALHMKWKYVEKMKSRYKKSGLQADRLEYLRVREEFQAQNRRARRSFEKETERKLSECPNSLISEAIAKDKSRRDSLQNRGMGAREKLNPASFTEFMASYHDQNQEVIELEGFEVPDNFKHALSRSIRKSKSNKSPGRDGVHNEMVKAEPELMAQLLLEWWRLVGRGQLYPTEWKIGLLTPVYKKGNPTEAPNYRPLCMFSCVRKVIETAIAETVAAKVKIFGRQYGFQTGLSATLTLLEVNSIVRSGRKKIATLDLAKAYDKVNRSILMKDCEKRLDQRTCNMLSAYLQPLLISTKGDILGKTAELRLGLIQGAQPSPTLFLIYINDIHEYYPRTTETGVLLDEMGNADLTLTADDVTIHTEDLEKMQAWLDACSEWEIHKGMRWESRKCTLVCASQEEVDPKIKCTIGGGEMAKATSASYLGMTLTTEGIVEKLNIERAGKAIQGAQQIAIEARLSTSTPQGRTRMLLNTYLRSSYSYNAIILENVEQITTIDREVSRKLFQCMLKSRARGIDIKHTKRLEALFQIVPLRHKLMQEALNLVKKLK